jgi:hypothetical protein
MVDSGEIERREDVPAVEEGLSPENISQPDKTLIQRKNQAMQERSAFHEPVPSAALVTAQADAPSTNRLSPSATALEETPEIVPDEEPEQTMQPSLMEEDEPVPLQAQLPDSTRKRRIPPILVVGLVVLIVLAGGVGAFALMRQHSSASATAQCTTHTTANCKNGAQGINPAAITRLVFSGAVSGPMTVSALPSCQSTTTANLRTLMVTLSGTVGGKLYNFGFAIERFLGPATYTNSTNSLLILFDEPGESTSNGWGNTAPTDTGSVTVNRGERAGTVNYLLSGFGSQAGKQIQVSGSWSCG